VPCAVEKQSRGFAFTNYEVATSPSVKGALELANSQRFDVFVLDSRLSDGSGIELCRRLPKIYGSTPIVFYSALAYEKDKQDGSMQGRNVTW
jgi:DNA-binding response OmpR family regulator